MEGNSFGLGLVGLIPAMVPLFGAFLVPFGIQDDFRGKAMAGSYPLREELLDSCGFPKDTELTRLHLHPGAKEMGMAPWR